MNQEKNDKIFITIAEIKKNHIEKFYSNKLENVSAMYILKLVTIL